MTLAGLLDRSAAARPGHPAVVIDGETLSYAELASRSDALARLLQTTGIGAGDRVGILLPKSLDMIVAIFAILKLGAAYVPVATGAPVRRVELLARDCAMAALVSDTQGVERLAASGFAAAPLVAAGTATVHGDAEELARPEPDPAAIAYILYTSGSTGNPKGVMVSHHAAMNFVRWGLDTFAVGPDDRLANLAPLMFDLSVFDIFVSVAAGATLHLITEARTIFPASLARYATDYALTIWYSVPAVLARMASHGRLDRHPMPAMRHILFAGEPFPVEPLARLMEQVPNASFHNLYGPTETNVVTHHRVLATSDRPIPIGTACAGHELLILDDSGAPVAGGEIGLLHVRGPSLMSGYCNQPAASAAALAPRPDAPGQPAYRTGDRVWRDADGLLHFAGRADAMVKSRGYRIEPGEIEHVLLLSPVVSEAAVIALPDADAGHRLVAVAAFADGAAGIDLRAHCASHLPGYMIPQAFIVRTDPLPRTATGKIDRRALADALGSTGDGV